MTYETIAYEARGAVAVLTLNRPERLNAISRRMIDELNAVLDAVEADRSVRALVLNGAGRAFCAGFDLKEGAGEPQRGVAEWRTILQRDFDIIMRFWRLRQPTIAAVHGYCLAGGCEMAMACDITIAAAGPKKAKELLLTGNDKVTAEEALAIGLVNRVVPEGSHVEAALALARDIAVMDGDSVALTKQAINRSFDIMGLRDALAMALDIEVQIESLDSEEKRTFSEISRRDGLKAALAWRDSRFGGS
jgi:enoyl-CoA hydratase